MGKAAKYEGRRRLRRRKESVGRTASCVGMVVWAYPFWISDTLLIQEIGEHEMKSHCKLPLLVKGCLPSGGLLLLAVMMGFSPATALADVLRISGTGSSIATIKSVSDAFLETTSDIEIKVVEPGMGSGGSIKGVIKDFLDIAMSARPLKDKEKAHGLVQQELGHNPFVIATAKGNTSTTGFSLKELARIYSGETTTWPDGSRIRLVLRPATDSDTAILKSMSPEMAEAVTTAFERKGVTYPATDQAAADLIERTPGAVGSCTLALIVSEQRPLRPLAIEGVTPSLATLRSGVYPYFKSLYVVTEAEPSNAVRQFVSFLTSVRGRQLLHRAGYVVIAE